MNEIIGRIAEKRLLDECLASDSSEFVAVYGRRRVGKTFLIKNYFEEKFDFYMTGSYNNSLATNLEYFRLQLMHYSQQEWPRAKSWLEAFNQLQQYLSELNKERVVVFIDELPWLDTPRSRFFTALELFWNGWADTRSNLKFIVCGSATTWMTNKLIGDKGGLHNRVTRRIYLAPFTLGECEAMLRSRGVSWNRHQIVECYMVMGGTPFYLKQIDKSLSLAQNIDRLFYSQAGQLRNEYDFLFRSLFKQSTIYKRVVELLARRSYGMTRQEILAEMRMSDSGFLSEVLQNLITCDFVREYRAFGMSQRNKLYQLTDLFTLFYLKQVKGVDASDNYWSSGIDSPSHRAWSGYAFEQVCLHHIPQIKAALSIGGVQSSVSSWICDQQGKRLAQVDMVIDRRDQMVNLCEMKYSMSEFTITPDYMQRILERAELFRSTTKTRKAIHITFITINGVKHNEQWNQIQSEVTAETLFS